MQTQPNTNKVLFPFPSSGGPTLTHADTGEAADLTYGHLPTTGNPLAKVDGTKRRATDNTITGPVPTAATVNGNTLTVTFDKALASLTDANALRYDLAVQGAGGLGVASAAATASTASTRAKRCAVSGTTLTLTLGVPARADDTVILSYGGTQLRGTGTGAKAAPMFRDLAVTNNTTGTAGPVPVRATLAGATLRVVFSEALNTASAPDGSAFFVEASANGDTRILAGTGTATINDEVVTVTLECGAACGGIRRVEPRVL